MLKPIAAAVAAMALAGCAGMESRTIEVPFAFDQENAEHFYRPGANSLTAHAVLRQRNGQPQTCAGLTAALIPATKYAEYRIRTIYHDTAGGYAPLYPHYTLDGAASEYLAATREEPCDANGYVTFDQLADGEYYVIIPITWQVPNAGTQGGAFSTRVALEGGEDREMILRQ